MKTAVILPFTPCSAGTLLCPVGGVLAGGLGKALDARTTRLASAALPGPTSQEAPPS